MSLLRSYFEEHAAQLADSAVLEVAEANGWTTYRLQPNDARSVGVVLYLGPGDIGTVRLDDPASAPAELGEDPDRDRKAVERMLNLAVTGGATAYHLGRGGCVEERDGTTATRTWHNAWPLPGWRRRATRVDYTAYR